MEVPQLTEQQRAKILQEIEQREFLEKAALEQEKQARQQQAELAYRESLALEHKRREDDRKQYISGLLDQSLKQLQDAIASFEEGDESGCYRFLVKLNPSLVSVQHRLTQSKAEGTVTGSLPTVRIKADNLLGFALINAADFIPGVHQVIEEGGSE